MGQSKLNKFDELVNAVKDFEKKFKDKTKNDWSERLNFVSHSGKYTLIEVDGDEEAEVKVNVNVHLTESVAATIHKELDVMFCKDQKVNS